VATPPSTVYRFDGSTGQWLDYSPLSGFQPLSATSVPGVPADFDILPARDGSHWFLTSTSAVVRLDLSLSSPLPAVPTTTLVAPAAPSRIYAGLSPTGQHLVRRDWTPNSGPSPNLISLVDVFTGGVIPWATLMGASTSNGGTIAVWR
jgi:hypothetical protein